MTKPMTLEELREKALLTEDEIEKVVDAWIAEDWSLRSVQLDRGHWEYIAPVISKAQQDKDWQTFIQFCEERGVDKNILL